MDGACHIKKVDVFSLMFIFRLLYVAILRYMSLMSICHVGHFLFVFVSLANTVPLLELHRLKLMAGGALAEAANKSMGVESHR